MTIFATEPTDVDKDFEVQGELTKTWIDSKSGTRHIRGVASGVEEDRDGERCSKRAIQSMVAQVNSGTVKLIAGHDQDWLSEFGDVTKGYHDDETGEFVIDCELPPDGQDPIADKAWRTVGRGKLGFSIGGKLHKAFFERSETGKRRKVLDEIGLKHVCLTAVRVRNSAGDWSRWLKLRG